MKNKKGLGFCVTLLIGAVYATLSASCASVAQQPRTPYVSPVQELLYTKGFGAAARSSSQDADLLRGTRWRVSAVQPKVDNFLRGTEFSFEGGGILVESAELPNGTIFTDTHRYRVLGSTLVLTKAGSTTVTLFRIEGDTLTIEADSHSIILERIRK